MNGPFPGMPQVPYNPYGQIHGGQQPRAYSPLVDVGGGQDRAPDESRIRLAQALLDFGGGQQPVEHPTQAIGNALGMMAEAKIKKIPKPKSGRPVPGSGTMNRKPWTRAPRRY